VIELTAGTVEYIPVEVRDRLKAIDTLAGTNAVFEYRLEGADVYIQTNQSCIVDEMQLLCLIDTTPLAVGSYELFVDFAIAPQFPRLGPIKFTVV
jgi:hypothetical protein